MTEDGGIISFVWFSSFPPLRKQRPPLFHTCVSGVQSRTKSNSSIVKVFQFLLKPANSLKVFPHQWISAILLLLAMAQEAVCQFRKSCRYPWIIKKFSRQREWRKQTSCDLFRHDSYFISSQAHSKSGEGRVESAMRRGTGEGRCQLLVL